MAEYTHIPTGTRVQSNSPLPAALYAPVKQAAPKKTAPKRTPKKEQ